jgi:hypothetical protein
LIESLRRKHISDDFVHFIEDVRADKDIRKKVKKIAIKKSKNPFETEPYQPNPPSIYEAGS